MPHPFKYFATITLALLLATSLAAVARQTSSPRWVTAWATSQQGLVQDGVTDATVRLIARVTAGGDSVRLRIDNGYGVEALHIGSGSIGHRMRGASLVPGTHRGLRFDGEQSVTIPPGGSVQSDPVALGVLARQDLAVSLHLPGASVRPSVHRGALTTSYASADGAGDVTGDDAPTAFTQTMTSMWWLKSIDVLTTSVGGSIVAFGDSITDGSCSTVDAHDRWEDWMAVRLDALRDPALRRAVVNEGIGGNTVIREHLQPAPTSTPGVERLERDVLSHAGVTDVILFMGTNDIRRDATAAQVIAGTQTIIERVHARGLRIHGVTIIPRHNRAPTENNSGWTPAKTRARNEVNAWIRTEAAFDGVIDFDQVVRDPADPNLILPAFNCDDIHPTPRGYYEMGRAVPLDLFASPLEP
jgi:lysophospholipase L1-like esterase